MLVACAHGTRSPDGQGVVRSLVADLRALRPGLRVEEAFVDVQEPAVADVVAAVLADAPGTGAAVSPAGRPAVVVAPLLLSTGFHVRHDIGAAVAGRPARAAAPIGPDRRLVTVLLQRLHEAGAVPGDAVVLAAAGSSDPAAAEAVREVTAGLAEAWAGPVTVGFGAAAEPTVSAAVAAARADGAGRVVVASYLLAPGHFHSALARAGADVVTAPLGPHPLLAPIVLDRYDAAVDGAGGTVPG
ncbi:sirohydrochlorin chelatase [Cellulomonas triticagri]|uniref:Sirohydrochlorin chelatase n=1 Tax=Cellulomonas triticagri TaxID=2483352 RepID=A0A3M2JDS3_9CELL|nr:sirohydrochlorin chelatase [Cellulomonas triticagri]